MRWPPSLFLILFSKSERPSENWTLSLPSTLSLCPLSGFVQKTSSADGGLPLEPWHKPWHRRQNRQKRELVNPQKWRISNRKTKKQKKKMRGKPSLLLLLLHYPRSLIHSTSYDVLFSHLSLQMLAKQKAGWRYLIHLQEYLGLLGNC